MIRALILSDTHTQHRNLKLPEFDMVIHCGDFADSLNMAFNMGQAEDFLDWYSQLGGVKVLIGGNHDVSLGKYLKREEIESKGIHYLEHESKVIEGIKFFGSPYTPRFGSPEWAFQYKRNRGQDVWRAIPDDTEVIVSHGPPKGILDLSRDFETGEIVQCGCKSLYNKIEQLPKLRYHFAGHIHSNKDGPLNNSGIFKKNELTFVNASCIMDGSYELHCNGYVLDLEF